MARPGQFGEVGRVQLRRAVLSVLGGLLFSDPGQIPEDDASICATTGQHGLLMWVPAEAVHLVIVADKAVELMLDVPQIPKSNRFIGGSSSTDVVRCGVERKTVDSIRVRSDGVMGFGVVAHAGVHYLESAVVRNGSKKMVRQRVEGDVIDNGGMMGVIGDRAQPGVGLGPGRGIPGGM